MGGEEHLDAAHDAWLAADVTEALQREDHLVHGRRVTRVGVLSSLLSPSRLAGTRSPYHPHQLASVIVALRHRAPSEDFKAVA